MRDNNSKMKDLTLDSGRLIRDMIRGNLTSDVKFDEMLQQVEKLRQGVGEGMKEKVL